jgi:hypothetical protein
MTNVSQIFGTLRNSEPYIILNSPETEVSGNLSILNNTIIKQNLDVCGNITFNNTDLSSVLSNLVVDLTGGQDASFNNVDISGNLTLTDINLTGNINGGSIINIDPAAHGDETGLVVIKGNLQIDGSSTIINSSIVDISDIAILLASNAPNLSATDGAGIDISGGASFKYKYSSGAFNDGHWESNIDLSCETINTQHIKNASKIVITTPLVEIENTGITNTFFNSSSSNYITGTLNWISSLNGGLHLDTYGTETESGVRIKNRGFSTSFSDTIFNYDNSGENYIRGRVNYITSFDDGIYLDASGATGANSGVQIVNGGGFNPTIFNYQNDGSNFIHGESRFFNDINVQTRLKVGAGGTPTVGISGQVLISQAASPNEWSNNPILPNYALLSGATFTGDVSINANLNFDRLGNETTNIRFTSSTQNMSINSPIGNHFPFIRIGDIEPSERHGFDFKFRDWTYNNDPINPNYSEYTLFRAYGNTSGNGQFQVFGTTYSTQSTWGTSDDRFKHGEYNIANGLETIRQLVPQTYKKTIKMLDEQNDGTNIGIEGEDWHWESGLIAQEVEQIPTLSKYVKDLDDAKYVSYNSIHVHTISAVKELDTIVQQQAQLISSLDTIVKQQAQLISSLEGRLLSLESK